MSLRDKKKEEEGRGDHVIIGGDRNASVQVHNAPGLIGKWARQKESINSGNDRLHDGTQICGGQHIPTDGVENQVHMVKRPLQNDDRLLSLPDAHVKMALRVNTQMLQVEHAKRPQNNTTEVAGDERGKEKAKMDTTTTEGGE